MAFSILGHRYSTARVSKRPSHETAACLRARYCTGLTCSDLDSLRYVGGSLQFHTVYSFKWKTP